MLMDSDREYEDRAWQADSASRAAAERVKSEMEKQIEALWSAVDDLNRRLDQVTPGQP